MATWHQLKRPSRTSHDTQWTVLIDPPGEPRGIARFVSKIQAEAYLEAIQARGQRYAYLIGPERDYEKEAGR